MIDTRVSGWLLIRNASSIIGRYCIRWILLVIHSTRYQTFCSRAQNGNAGTVSFARERFRIIPGLPDAVPTTSTATSGVEGRLTGMIIAIERYVCSA